MGEGIGFKCSRCQKEYGAFWGIGFMFPIEYEKEMRAAKAGKYGAEWKNLTKGEKYVAIDASSHVYVCGKCGYWNVEPNRSLYVPKNPEALRIKYKMECGKKLESRKSVMPCDLAEDYRILKRRMHKCGKCGSIMRRIRNVKRIQLPCPYCGGAPEESGENRIIWD